MALDPELISAYFDDEIPSPWKERLAAQVERDHEASARFQGYQELREKIVRDRKALDLSIPEMEARVLDRIADQVSAGERRSASSLDNPLKRFFRSSLTLPLPLAAAAALLLFFGLGFGLARGLAPTQEALLLPEISSGTEFGWPQFSASTTMSPVSNLNSGLPLSEAQISILQQLYSQGGAASFKDQTPGPGVTITLQDVNQLLELLQGAASVREFSIEIPTTDDLELLGSPTLLRGSSRSSSAQGDARQQ